MSEPFGSTRPDQEPTVGTLVNQLTTQVPELIRSEIRLAQAEMTEKGKRAGAGLGAFSAAGLLAFLGLATLVATAVLGLVTVLDAWLAALIVAIVLLAVAAVAALVGKKEVDQAAPAKPERAVAGLKEDVATMKGDRQ